MLECSTPCYCVFCESGTHGTPIIDECERVPVCVCDCRCHQGQNRGERVTVPSVRLNAGLFARAQRVTSGTFKRSYFTMETIN